MAKLRVPVKRHGKMYGYKRVPDRGAPGRTPPEKRWYEARGTMQGWNKDMPARSRRRILSHMVRTQGYLKVFHKLLGLRNVGTDRETDRVARADMAWMKRKYRSE